MQERAREGRGADRDDGELVRRALLREPEAVERFVARMRCVARILGASNARAGRPFDAQELEDLVQETLTAVWRKLPNYDASAALETWVHRFCQLEFLRKLRTKSRGRLVLEESLEGSPYEPQAPPVRSVLDDQHLLEGLERLEPDVASVLRLKHYEDLTFEDIGARLGTSPNTAKTRYYRGLRKLRAELEKTRAARGARRS